MKKTTLVLSILSIAFSTLLAGPLVGAQPYGKGLYNEDVPYGNQTSLSITTNGNLTVPITPTTAGVLGTGNNIVTVTTTDVKGYKLYVRALSSTNLTNFTSTIPTTVNVTMNPLEINSWGYNTDASTNFLSMPLSPNDALLRTVNTPAKSGSATTVTYGMKVDLAKAAGNYSTNVVYTAVPQTD